MSYNIETRSLSEFVTDSKIRLPRFQRRSIWNQYQNFELAISIFQEYPVGVVIINDEGHISWLLDGRQRRTALRDLRANPDQVYDWAKAYLKIKANTPDDVVANMFWKKIDNYLQKEDIDNSSDHNDVTDDTDMASENFDNESEDINRWRQRRGLKILLNMILMVHQKDRSGHGKWEREFNLKQYIDRPSYAPKREGYVVNPVSLRAYLLEYSNSVDEISKNSFFQYMDDHGGVKDGQDVNFKNYLDLHWDFMYHVIDTIAQSEQIFIDARIGVILLKNVTPLDAQKIFSRINSGGTQLKAEELLSAKPFWNIPVQENNNKMFELVKGMYQRLGVDTPTDGSVVRWDYGATLISRIHDNHLLFDEYMENADKNKIDMTQVTLGFKLMSSYFEGGMSAIVVSKLEQSEKIKWGQSINDLVDDVNSICNILLGNEFFRFFCSWRKSVFKLLGNAIVLEYLTILIHDWHEKECPMNATSSQYKSFIRDAKILLDKLIFEYAIGAWKGSGDSKMAGHLKNWSERLRPLDDNAWEKFIEETANGEYNGQPMDIKHLTPVLCYQYALLKRKPEVTLEQTSEVDHIFPQAKFSDNPLVNQKYKDCLFNLMLLPKEDNIKKKDKSLDDIDDAFLRQSVSKYSGVSLDDFHKFSDISNIEEFKAKRLQELKRVFGSIRKTELAN